MSWTGAEFQARANRGHLVAINDNDENSWLFTTFRSAMPSGGLWLGAWIGLWDGKTEGVYRWVGGDLLAYTRWLRGQPDNSGGLEDYVLMFGNSGPSPSKWGDRTGSQNFPGIIERVLAPDNAIATHSGSGGKHVPVAIVAAGDVNNWDFGVINPMGHFIPSWQIRRLALDGGMYRLGFRNRFGPSVIIPMDDPRVKIELASEHPDGTARTLILKLDAEQDGTLEFQVVLQVKNLADSLEPVHINDTP